MAAVVPEAAFCIRWSSSAKDCSNGDGGIEHVLGTEPTAEFAELAQEESQRLLDCLDDGLLRRIGLLRLEGYTVDESAAQLERVPGRKQR